MQITHKQSAGLIMKLLTDLYTRYRTGKVSDAMAHKEIILINAMAKTVGSISVEERKVPEDKSQAEMDEEIYQINRILYGDIYADKMKALREEATSDKNPDYRG